MLCISFKIQTKKLSYTFDGEREKDAIKFVEFLEEIEANNIKYLHLQQLLLYLDEEHAVSHLPK
jgi:hypothetical protein